MKTSEVETKRKNKMMKSILTIIYIFLCFPNFAQAQKIKIVDFQNKRSLFSNTSFILNESFIGYLQKVNLKKYTIKGFNQECYYLCSYGTKDSIHQVVCLINQNNNLKFMIWNNDLNDWYFIAEFFEHPTITNQNTGAIIDKSGNYCTFPQEWSPTSVSCNFLFESDTNDFSLSMHEENYLSKEKNYLILDEFKISMENGYLEPKQIIEGTFIPFNFFYNGKINTEELFYVHHVKRNGYFYILCFKKETNNNDCVVEYTFFRITINDNNDVSKINEIGKISYIRNTLYYYDFKLNAILNCYPNE